MHRFLLALVACLAPLAAQQTSGGPPIPEQDCYDVRHYHLALTVDPSLQRIDGTLTMRCDATPGTARIALDLDERLEVKAVHVTGREAAAWLDGPAGGP